EAAKVPVGTGSDSPDKTGEERPTPTKENYSCELLAHLCK
ncbi:MAG: hypothetical protein RL193_1193, partial [Actinomycetota bacterium]